MLVNFHHDPVACAVALGWPAAVVEERPLLPLLDGGVLRFETDKAGRPTRVVVRLDGEAFANVWITAVEAAQHQR
jgi:hypothetical protein